jgi:hypothetical protein
MLRMIPPRCMTHFVREQYDGDTLTISGNKALFLEETGDIPRELRHFNRELVI